MYESNDKMVSHPDHYQSENGIEVIDVIEAFTADLKGAEAVCAGNALKYICRYKKKNGAQDIKKAIWYLTRLLEKLEKTEAVKESFDFKNIAILDSEGNTQAFLIKSWMPYVDKETDRTFTVKWLEPGDLCTQFRTYSKPDFEYRIIQEGE
jgi:hypothetical protein